MAANGRTAAAALVIAAAGTVRADDNPIILQWFETRWDTMEYRMPDFFVAGYDATWLPPVSKPSDPSSPGYDPFDRFDLGSPGSQTAYGTEGMLRSLIAEFHRAGAQVYIDSIMNHNSGRTSNSSFLAAGGWPGFYLPGSGPDFWGDFHDGTQQSHDPGGANYNLWNGDLVGLIDIAQEKNYQYIRHPVTAGDPQNIPQGTVYNRPNPANARFYPDLQLAPSPPLQDAGQPINTFVNPATGQSIPFRVFNLGDPSAGDAVAENATGLLVRWTSWMMDDLKVDGFRLDAAKHIPQWFWNNYWDNAVYKRRITPAGTRATGFSFVESVENNSFTLTYTRKDGFGFRDALDLNGAGALRDLLNAGGFGSWQNVVNAHLDTTDDGFQNGSRGLLHVWSHDNGSSDGTPPPIPGPEKGALPEFAYILSRPGISIVYHNGREMADLFTSRGFWPDEGSPSALGLGSGAITRLVQIGNGYARGEYNPINSTDSVNSSNADVLVYERRTPTGGGNYVGNLLVAVNDRNDSGTQTRNVQTSFPQGTRLHELTGNWADPAVNPGGTIPELLVTDANRRVSIVVPNNVSSAGAHHKGYVLYGPAAPSGTLTIQGTSGTIAADSASVPSYRRRLTPVEIVTGSTFTILLQTTKTDPLDPNFDDNALYRIDGGYADTNGNGSIDFGEGAGVAAGYEQFLTFNRPLYTNPTLPGGTYFQTISTALLDEGYHYISVIAFRHRSDGGAPIFTEFRKVIYVDRSAPQVALTGAGTGLCSTSPQLSVIAGDRGTNRVHILADLAVGVDPIPLCNSGNQATRVDRYEWRRTLPLAVGTHSITVVGFEPSGNSVSQRYENVQVVIGNGDINRSDAQNMDDMYDFFSLLPPFRCEGDLDSDGDNDARDLRFLEIRLRPTEATNMAGGQR